MDMATGDSADLDLAVVKKKSALFGILINIGIGLLLVAVNVGVTYFLISRMLETHYAQISTYLGPGDGTANDRGSQAAAISTEPPIFVSLDPVFVVNFGNIEEGRYLQAQIEVMSRDSGVGNAIKNLMPMVRDTVIQLLGRQNAATIGTREGMDALQEQVRSEINTILETNGETGGVEKVYFTSFVMQ